MRAMKMMNTLPANATDRDRYENRELITTLNQALNLQNACTLGLFRKSRSDAEVGWSCVAFVSANPEPRSTYQYSYPKPLFFP